MGGVCKIKNVKVSNLIVGIFDELTHFHYITNDIFKKHHISANKKENSIALSDWLDALDEVKDIFGPAMLYYIAKKTFFNAKWPKNINTLSQALSLIDDAYHQTHTKGDIGHYRFEQISDYVFCIYVTTPYKREFNLGLLRGLCDNFTFEKLKSTISVEEKLNTKYADSTIYKIELSPSNKNIDTDKTPIWVNDKNALTDELLKESFTVMNNYIYKFKALQKRLEKKAYEDELTKLGNRFKLELYADTVFRQLARESEYINVAMFDIDFFKQYNDKYGHLKGDKLLKKIAHIINKNANRPYDLAIRYGGEEILLFLPYSDNENAVNIVENIRKEIENLKSKITISAGLIHKQICPNDNLYNMIDLVDKLLYEAKHNGRNMVINSKC